MVQLLERNGVGGLQLSQPLPAESLRELMIGRMVQGVWKPGAVLPSEVQLAAEFGVSQGTVRKALDFMEDYDLIARPSDELNRIASLPIADG